MRHTGTTTRCKYAAVASPVDDRTGKSSATVQRRERRNPGLRPRGGAPIQVLLQLIPPLEADCRRLFNKC